MDKEATEKTKVLDGVPLFEEDVGKGNSGKTPPEDITSGNEKGEKESKKQVTPTTGGQLIQDPTSVIPKKFLDPEGNLIPEKLVKSYNSLSRKQGGNTGDSGVPASADEYIVEGEFNNIPEDVMGAFKNSAFENSLNSDQLNWFFGVLDKSYSDDNSMDVNSLKKSWGDDYSKNLESAAKGWDSIKGEVDFPISEVRNSPIALRILSQMGAKMGEDKSPASASTNNATMADVDKLMSSDDYFKNPAKQVEVKKMLEKLV